MQLIGLRLFEPALIIALVAVAACSERLRRVETNGAKKKRGDDATWFSRFLDESIGMTLVIDGEDTSLSSILYKQLRCEAIHEAETTIFSPKEEFMSSHLGGQLTFGLHLLDSLLDAVRTARDGRDQFRDLLHEVENLVEFREGGELEKDVWKRLGQEFGLPGRMMVLERIVKGLTPEAILAMTYADASRAWRDNILPNLHVLKFHDGHLNGLTLVDQPALANKQLTENGYNALQSLSQHYVTIDKAR